MILKTRSGWTLLLLMMDVDVLEEEEPNVVGEEEEEEEESGSLGEEVWERFYQHNRYGEVHRASNMSHIKCQEYRGN